MRAVAAGLRADRQQDGPSLGDAADRFLQDAELRRVHLVVGGVHGVERGADLAEGGGRVVEAGGGGMGGSGGGVGGRRGGRGRRGARGSAGSGWRGAPRPCRGSAPPSAIAAGSTS